MFLTRQALSFILAIIAALPLAASANPTPDPLAEPVIYRGVDAQGNTVFSTNPKDMRNPKKIQLAPPLISGASPYPPASPSRPASSPERPLASSSNASAANEPPLSKSEARERLEAAKKAMLNGVEPLPGERSGTANGGTRLNSAYETRQRALAAAAQSAQSAYDAAVSD